MAVCEMCGRKTSWLDPFASGKYCGACWPKVRAAEDAADRERIDASQAGRTAIEAEAARIILTTETAHNLPVSERLDIVTAEVIVGMHLFKDIASAFRDTFGGRSKVMQDGLRQARKTALDELRLEAHALGADAVVGVDLDYSEISGGGKSMLFLVASGTAVKLDQGAPQ